MSGGRHLPPQKKNDLARQEHSPRQSGLLFFWRFRSIAKKAEKKVIWKKKSNSTPIAAKKQNDERAGSEEKLLARNATQSVMEVSRIETPATPIVNDTRCLTEF